MRIGLLLSAALAATAVASAASAAQELVNGAFATGDFTGWTLTPTANGTLGFGAPPAVALFSVVSGVPQNAARLAVGNVTFVPGDFEGGSLSQTFSTGAGELVFSTDVAITAVHGSNANGGTISVLLDGVSLDSFSVGSISTGDIFRDQLNFDQLVLAGSHTLSILAVRDFQSSGVFGQTPFQYITNASADFTPSGGGSVPEPASWAMMLAGLGATGAILRRQRQIARPLAS